MPEDDKRDTYEERTKDDLLEEAKDRGIEVPSSANKPDVISALQEDDRARLNTAVASGDEPWASVEYVGPNGQVCDVLLPYMQDRGDLENGKEYSAPVSVIRQVVLNGNFEPADDAADNMLDREERRSRAGRLRAQRLMASPVASGETPEAFDARVGISRPEQERVGRSAVDDLPAESPEFDPMAEFYEEEG